MKSISINASLRTLSVLAVLALGACGGGSSGVPAIVVDMTGVVGTGTALDPYVLPAENQPGVTQTFDTYLDKGGYWQVAYDAINVNVAGTPVVFGTSALVDVTNDTVTVTIDSTDYILTNTGFGDYDNGGCTPPTPLCVEFVAYDAGLVAGQYGTFGDIFIEDGLNDNTALIYLGLKTPAADVPTIGSATYTGTFEGGSTALGGDAIDPTATMTADFAGGTFTFASAGNLTDEFNAVVGSYTLNSDVVTIVGNGYGGTATGSVTNAASVLDASYTGTMEGAFFGPGVAETAGAIAVESATTPGDFLGGGFWGAK